MNKLKIYVYAISKNESAFVDRWMDAISEADGVIVVDTGSEDDTVAKLKARGAQVYEETFSPWRFDTARNAAMSHIPEDADICVSNDIDEVFEPGWRQHLEDAWDTGCTRAKYWFVWEEKSKDVPEKMFIMEKIHTRHNFKWIHPVHEVLEYSGTQPDKSVFIDRIKLIHKPDPKKSRSQYLSLLELSSKENPYDDRTKFWLGREYFFSGNYDKAIITLKEHLKMPTALWDEENCASMRFIARAYHAKNDIRNTSRWLHKAIAECSTVREPWLDLARLGYDTQNWPLSLWASENGLAVKTSSKSYLVEPASWGYLLEDYAAIASYQLKFYDKALQHAIRACEIAPDDNRLKNNLTLIQAKINGGISNG